MRKIIKQGKPLRTVECPECGQVEKQTEDESLVCLNCGATMNIVENTKEEPSLVSKKEENPPVVAKKEKKEKKEKYEDCPSLHRRGPKPKRCRTCAKAMATLNNMYTCKDTMTLKNAGDTCEKWVKGIPVGEAE